MLVPLLFSAGLIIVGMQWVRGEQVEGSQAKTDPVEEKQAGHPEQ